MGFSIGAMLSCLGASKIGFRVQGLGGLTKVSRGLKNWVEGSGFRVAY